LKEKTHSRSDCHRPPDPPASRRALSFHGSRRRHHDDSTRSKDTQLPLPGTGARRRSLLTALQQAARRSSALVHHAWAQAAKKPLVIGPRWTRRASTRRRAPRSARGDDGDQGVNDKGGVLAGASRRCMDTETTPATGSRVAERMITRNEAAFLIGGVHSGVANAISQVAQKYGCIYFNTNSSSPTESGKDCHRVKFVWDGNGTNFAKAIVRNAITVNGKNWVLLTNDYVWGHNTSKATRTLAEADGAKIVDEMMIPQNTRDFSSYLIQLQQLKPEVVAAAVGGDDIKALRQQVVQLGLQKRMAWINNQQDWPDVYGLGPDAIFGVFGTTWYYRLDLPGVKEFVASYQKVYPGMAIRVPGNVYLNGCPRPGAVALRRSGHHQQHRRDQARRPQDVGAGPHAASRRLDRPGDAPVPADDLHGELQRQAGGARRHLQDPVAGVPAGRGRRRRAEELQAGELRADAGV
jgi:branched-chain amino acid transport system substrate-binding protein